MLIHVLYYGCASKWRSTWSKATAELPTRRPQSPNHRRPQLPGCAYSNPPSCYVQLYSPSVDIYTCMHCEYIVTVLSPVYHSSTHRTPPPYPRPRRLPISNSGHSFHSPSNTGTSYRVSINGAVDGDILLSLIIRKDARSALLVPTGTRTDATPILSYPSYAFVLHF